MTGTKLDVVYDAFLAKIEGDDWMETEYLDIAKRDWRMLLSAGVFHFRYPRISLRFDNENFEEILGNDEIQILSSLMRREWLDRTLATWDNIRALYSDKDFSQANFLDKLTKNAHQAKEDCESMLDDYDRSVNYKPNKIFSSLAGKRK